MNCPACKTQTIVCDSREQPDGSTRRRRVCANGHKFTSKETPLLTGLCRHTLLKKYPTAFYAWQARRKRVNKQNLSAHLCEHCSMWHLTQAEKTDKNFQQT
jgi:hypothetical protein